MPVTTPQDHFGKKKPVTVTDYIPLDPDVAQEYTTAQDALKRAQTAAEAVAHATGDNADRQRTEATDRLAAAQARHDTAEAAFRDPENSAKVVFRNPGSNAWTRLKAAHPPVGEQAEANKRNPQQAVDFDAESIKYELIAATMVEPKLTVDEVRALYDDPAWTEAELTHLFTLAYTTCTVRRRGGTYSFS